MRIYIKVTPRASKNEVVKISEGEYKVKITAPPVDGAANVMLVKILSEYFAVSKSSVQIVGGKTARTKIVDIA
ncbi:MAG: YggU family protein [Candidatus Moranbacteria bacterium RBG_19FT_COMBO_42_6]|nr:MAG: YggU family protein [Candidatus Moranbacteria bacterium RBG_19FT_COMBO_42_6]